MLEYKKPSKSNIRADKGEYIFPPNTMWPKDYVRPDFVVWRKQNENAIVRNCLVLLFHYLEIKTSETANFFELSESRVRSIISSTKKRLFGKSYESSVKKIESISNLSSNNIVLKNHYSETIENLKNNKPEIKAIFWAISSVSYNTSDVMLFHNSVEYLSTNNIINDLSIYNDFS